jgi:hypothetical protein
VAQASIPTRQGGSFLKKGENLAAAQLAADNGLTRPINPVDLKNGLRKIQTDHGDFVHGAAPSSRFIQQPRFGA